MLAGWQIDAAQCNIDRMTAGVRQVGATGMDRCGADTAEHALALAHQVTGLPGLRLAGYDAFHVVHGGVVVGVWPVIPRGPAPAASSASGDRSRSVVQEICWVNAA